MCETGDQIAVIPDLWRGKISPLLRRARGPHVLVLDASRNDARHAPIQRCARLDEPQTLDCDQHRDQLRTVPKRHEGAYRIDDIGAVISWHDTFGDFVPQRLERSELNRDEKCAMSCTIFPGAVFRISRLFEAPQIRVKPVPIKLR
jgi:hypothetical protein